MSKEDSEVEVNDLLCNSLTFDLTWKDSIRQIILTCIAHSLVIQAGINMAFSAVLLPQLKDDEHDILVSKSQASWIASIVTISTPCGALITGPLMDHYGRKKICILTTIPFIIAWLLHANAKNVWHIYISRILAGFAGGLSTVALVYVSEITHSDFRSMLLSLNSVFVSFGILINCIFGFWFHWRTMCYLFASMITFSSILLILIPESPYWLLTFKKDSQEAAKSLRCIYKNDRIYENQFEQLQRADFSTKRNSSYNIRIYFESKVYKPLGMLFIIFLIQQLSGAYAIIFYAVDVFRKIGGQFGQGLDAFGALIILGTIRFVISIVCAFLSKRIGRRVLLLVSGFGMCATSLLAGIYLQFTHSELSVVDNTIVLTLVLGYVCFSSLGFLVIPWTLIGELLPIKVRGKLGGFVVAIAYLLMAAVVKFFPYVLDALKMQQIFCSFALINVIGGLYIYFYLPETLGKSFMEIEKYFE